MNRDLPMESCPRVSVLTPVRNGAKYLESALNSILGQTFDDFELVIVDDGSSDSTPEILQSHSLRDSRIRIVSNTGAAGVANALNLGLNLCRGEYIARHDADDLSFPERLARQVEYLDMHPDIAIVGSQIQMINEAGEVIRQHGEPTSAAAVRFHALFGTPFAHPSVMFRRDALGKAQLCYREIPAQDYDLWTRMLDLGLRGANMAETLVGYRVFQASDSHVRAGAHAKVADELAKAQLQCVLGVNASLERFSHDRCRQIAHALICEDSFQFCAGDEAHGDAVIEIGRSATAISGVAPEEMSAFIERMEHYWYSVRSTLAVQSQLNRRPGRIKQAASLAVRYFISKIKRPTQAEREAFAARIPIIINARDRVSELRQLIAWLKNAGHQRIIILDNGSTYGPMIEFLADFDGEVIRLGKNLGHTALWQTPQLADIIRRDWFVYSDPDVVPLADCPSDAVSYLYDLLLRFPRFEKAGLGLKIDDLPDCFGMKKKVIQWESKQYRREVAPGVFDADIDTTFALYRPNTPYCYGPALRTLGAYQARHMPWYADSRNPTEEEQYYSKRALKNVTTWSGDGSSAHRLEVQNG
ncbi:MAG TPA: hypothetical protein DHV59_14705 [Oxalobacteraceae bacterium]|nr:hypothetical protein [Oxalobacteraceae bacterium]